MCLDIAVEHMPFHIIQIDCSSPSHTGYPFNDGRTIGFQKFDVDSSGAILQTYWKGHCIAVGPDGLAVIDGNMGSCAHFAVVTSAAPTAAPTSVPTTATPTSAPTQSPVTTPPTSVPTIAPTKPAPVIATTGGNPHFKTWSGQKFDVSPPSLFLECQAAHEVLCSRLKPYLSFSFVIQFHGGCDLVLVTNPAFASWLGMDIYIRTKIKTSWSHIETGKTLWSRTFL